MTPCPRGPALSASKALVASDTAWKSKPNPSTKQRSKPSPGLERDPWMEQVGNVTALDIEIRESDATTKHSVTLKQVESWLGSTSSSPHVASKKTRLKMILMRG